MSAAGAAPEELELLARTMRSLADLQRDAARRVEVGVEALGSHRRALGPLGDDAVRLLRVVLSQADELASEAADAAVALRSADELLARLLGALPDWHVEWTWPPGWVVERHAEHGRSSAEIELGAGTRVEAGGSLGTTSQSIGADLFAEARAGLWAMAAAGTALGPVAAHAAAEAFAGAKARLDGVLRVGADGAEARLGGEAFAGASVEGEVHAGAGPVQAGGKAGVSYGVGVTADADFELGPDRLGGRIDLGAALGLGLRGGFEGYVEPSWVADGLARVGDEVLSVGTDLLGAGRSLVGSLGGLW